MVCFCSVPSPFSQIMQYLNASKNNIFSLNPNSTYWHFKSRFGDIENNYQDKSITIFLRIRRSLGVTKIQEIGQLKELQENGSIKWLKGDEKRWSRVEYNEFTEMFYQNYIRFEDQQKYKLMGHLFRVGFFLLLLGWAHSQCCLKFQGRACISCPTGLHLYRGNCLIDTDNCAKYKDGFDCEACISGYNLNSTGECNLIPPSPPPPPPAPDFKDTDIKVDDLTNPYADYFMLSNDYFISLYLLADNPKVLGSRARQYKNGSIIVTIEYQGKSGKIYQGVIQPNLSTFIFTEKSFKEIPKPTIIKSPSTASYDPKIPQHFAIATELELVISLQNKNINKIISGKITAKPDDTVIAVLQYSGKTVGDEFEITANYDSGNKLTGFTVSQTKKAPVVIIKENPQKIGTNDKNIAPPGLNYTVFDIKTVRDPFYGITKDFIGNTNPKYKILNPSKAEQSVVNTIKYFRLEFTLEDGSKWQVLANIDTKTFIISVQKEVQISASKTPTQAPYITIPKAQAYKDFDFLFVLAQIDKQTNGKYKGLTAKTVERQDNVDGSKNYKAVFEKEDFEWILQGKIQKFVVTGVKETKGQEIKSLIQNNSAQNKTQITPVENKTEVKPEVKPVQNKTQTIPQVKPVENKTQPVTQNKTVVTPQQPPSKTETTPEVKPPIKPQSAPKEVPLPSSVMSLTVGLQKLSKEDEKGSEFTQINDLLRQVSPQLATAEFLGSFFSMQSFTRNYQIYYRMAEGLIYEARVARDLLRRRTYIISFGKIGF